MGVVIKDNYLKYGGKRYFKAGSNSISIRKFGEKKEPILAANYLMPVNEIPAPKLEGKISSVSTVSIDTASTKKKHFKANIDNFLGIFGMSGDAAWQKVKAGEYVFLHLGIDMGDLKQAYNHSPKSRTEFADVKGAERAVCEVFIAMVANEAEVIANSANFGIEMDGGKLKLAASGGASGSSTTKVSISPGTVYAYMLAKPTWTNGKSEISYFTDDQHGMN